MTVFQEAGPYLLTHFPGPWSRSDGATDVSAACLPMRLSFQRRQDFLGR